jgi:FkbM family methyltransferase
LRSAADSSGVSRWPFVGSYVVRPLGSLARRAIIGRRDLSYIEVDGHVMRMDPDLRRNSIRYADPLFYYMAFRSGDYERGTTRVFKELLRPGMVAVDVGAHVGYYTLLAARQVGPSGTVVAFEPDRRNFRVLRQNVRLNGYRNVRALPMAVSDRRGEARLFTSELDSQDHSLYELPLVSDRGVSVETTTLDAFFDAREWPRVDFVKIDVEGAEPAVLRGMRGLVERCPEMTLVIECNPFTLSAVGVSRAELVRQLRSLGFSVRAICDDGPQPTDERGIERFSDGVNLLCRRTSGQ